MKVSSGDEYPIDAVIYWVDGNDSVWQAEKTKYIRQSGKDDSKEENRYRDWDNLQYIFRGIEKYMPWINKIFFITCGHFPKWLNTNNPKLVCVRHVDYMRKDYLPTFSSHPIELNLHRIPDLSEHFIVFNDDTFVIDRVRREDFFRKGIPVDQFMEYPVMMGGDSPVMAHVFTNIFSLIGRYFTRSTIKKCLRKKIFSPRYGIYFFYNMIIYLIPFPKFFGVLTPHFTRPYLKSSFKELWLLEEEYLDSVSRNKFRSKKDVNIYVFRIWNMLNGNFVPSNVLKMGKAFYLKNKDTSVNEIIEKRKYKLVCINDECVKYEDFLNAKESVNMSLNKILPELSSYEILL